MTESYSAEISIQEWEENFDEIFKNVEDGETFLIRDEKGRGFYLMPIDDFCETEMNQTTSNMYPVTVTENTDGSFTIDWDENDPVTSQMNTWTKEDFRVAITAGLEDELLMLLEQEFNG